MKRAQASNGLLSLVGGALIICVFAIGFLYFLKGGDDVYNAPVNETQYQAFNQSQQIINLTENTQAQFVQFNSSTGTSTLDIITVITTGGYNTLKIIGSIPAIYNSIIVGAGNVLGIPAEISVMLFYFIVVMIIIIFIVLVFRVT